MTATKKVFNGKDIHVAFKPADGTYKDIGVPITKLENFTFDFGKEFEDTEVLGTELKTLIENLKDWTASFTRQMDYLNFPYLVRNNPMGCDLSANEIGGPTYTTGKLTNAPTADIDGWIIDIFLNYTGGATAFAAEPWLTAATGVVTTLADCVIVRLVCSFSKMTPSVPAGGHGTEDVPLVVQRGEVLTGSDIEIAEGLYNCLDNLND